MKNSVRRIVLRAGLAEPARQALQLIQPARRRDRLDNEHLRLLLAFSLKEDANCVDIGCNHGVVLADIVELAPAGVHYAFEPIPVLADELTRRFPNVNIRQIALSDQAGTAEYTHVIDADGLSGLRDRGLGETHSVGRIEVEVGRLDDVLPQDYVPTFIKIDVEGAELQVLQGSLRTLRRHKPALWFEHGHRQAGFYGTTSNDVWDLLCRDLDYRIFDADGVGPYTRAAFDALAGVLMWSFAAHL